MCECRNSDDIMVVIGDDKNCDVNNIFDDDAFNRANILSVRIMIML